MGILNSFVLPVLLGVVSSLLVVMFVEYMRKPTLALEISAPDDQKHNSDHPAREMRCLRVRVTNTDLPWALRWMRRETAAHCRANVRFEHLDGTSLFGEGMNGRWAASPEPVPLEALFGTSRLQIWDANRMSMTSETSIPAGESEELDIAVRCDADADAYGWSNQSYQPPFWKNPRWRIDRGKYQVRVTVRSGGAKVERLFRLDNDGQRSDFHLDHQEKGLRRYA